MSSDGNYAAYRDKVRRLESACVPYLGLYMKDVSVTLEEGEKYNPATGKFNLAKLRILIHMLREFENCRRWKDDAIVAVPALFTLPEDELYRLTSKAAVPQ